MSDRRRTVLTAILAAAVAVAGSGVAVADHFSCWKCEDRPNRYCSVISAPCNNARPCNSADDCGTTSRFAATIPRCAETDGGLFATCENSDPVTCYTTFDCQCKPVFLGQYWCRQTPFGVIGTVGGCSVGSKLCISPTDVTDETSEPVGDTRQVQPTASPRGERP